MIRKKNLKNKLKSLIQLKMMTLQHLNYTNNNKLRTMYYNDLKSVNDEIIKTENLIEFERNLKNAKENIVNRRGDK